MGGQSEELDEENERLELAPAACQAADAAAAKSTHRRAKRLTPFPSTGRRRKAVISHMILLYLMVASLVTARGQATLEASAAHYDEAANESEKEARLAQVAELMNQQRDHLAADGPGAEALARAVPPGELLGDQSWEASSVRLAAHSTGPPARLETWRPNDAGDSIGPLVVSPETLSARNSSPPPLSSVEPAQAAATRAPASNSSNHHSQVPKSGLTRGQLEEEPNVIGGGSSTSGTTELPPTSAPERASETRGQARDHDGPETTSNTDTRSQTTMPSTTQAVSSYTPTTPTGPNEATSSTQAATNPNEPHTEATNEPTPATSSTEASAQAEFTPESLHDNNGHESDKLRPYRQQQSETTRPKFELQANSNLSSGHNLPPAVSQPRGYHQFAAGLWPHVAAVSGPAASLRELPAAQTVLGHQQRARHHDLRQRPGGLIGSTNQAAELLHQSSLQPKHLPPPPLPPPDPSRLAVPAHLRDQWVGMAARPPPPAADPMGHSSAHRPGGFAGPLQASSLRPELAVARRRPLVVALRSKGRGLLPRLAAKLFSADYKGTTSTPSSGRPGEPPGQETLGQLQSYQLATHNAPSPVQTSTARGKLFLPKPSGLVKSLFGGRDPLAGAGSGKITLIGAVRRPALITKGEMKQQQQQQQANNQPSSRGNLPPTRLVLMNGQVYSVLATGPQPTAPGSQAESGAQVFDHATSDTSEFPVFEAMSMQHVLPQPVDEQAQQAARSGPSGAQTGTGGVRCDRPRHVIQADRSVVNHILQSQQNFVIARVPIKKYVRPSESAPAPAPSHVYHAYPMPALMNGHPGDHAPLVQAGAAGGGGFGPPLPASYAFATDRIPVYRAQPIGAPSAPGPTSIEVSASVPRHSIWHSLASLVSSLRYGVRRPIDPQATPTQLMAGSSPHSLFLDGPAALYLARRVAYNGERRHQRMRGGWRDLLSSRRRLLWDEATSGGQFLPAAVLASILQEQAALAAAASMAQAAAQMGEPTAAASSASGYQEPIDPMRRLLMLKTATDNEVCSPVSEFGSKIKYSCVPNHCVVMALANTSTSVAQESHPAQVNSNMPLYKAPSSQGGDTGQPGRRPPGQQARQNHLHYRPLNESSGTGGAEEQVQVQQFDDVLPHQQPLVTYTHINAYQPPAISKLAQPQHQQLVGTTQTLDALANGETNFGEDQDGGAQAALGDFQNQQQQHQQQAQMGPAMIYQPFGYEQASSLAADGASGLGHAQPAYGHPNVGVAGGGGNNWHRLNGGKSTSSSSQAPAHTAPRSTLTFGSAYIPATNSQSATVAALAPHGAKATTGAARMVYMTTQPTEAPGTSSAAQGEEEPGGEQEAPGEDNNYGPSVGSVSEPNEFLSAVDEKLERPIPVIAGQRERNKAARPAAKWQPSPVRLERVRAQEGVAQASEDEQRQQGYDRQRHQHRQRPRAPRPDMRRPNEISYGQKQRRRSSNTGGGWRPATGPTLGNGTASGTINLSQTIGSPEPASSGRNASSRLATGSKPGTSWTSEQQRRQFRLLEGPASQAGGPDGVRANEGSAGSAPPPEDDEDEEEESVSSDYDTQNGDEEPSVQVAPGPHQVTARLTARPLVQAARGRPSQVPVPLPPQPQVEPQPLPAVNVSQTIAVVNGRAVYPGSSTSGSRERKTRHEGHRSTTSTTSAPRYGLRQSTPLPPPEKGDEEPTPPTGPYFADEESATQTGADEAPGSSTECDCNRPTSPASDSGATPPDSGEEAEPRPPSPRQRERAGSSSPSPSSAMQQSERRNETTTAWPQQQLAGRQRVSAKRNPTTLRPISGQPSSSGLHEGAGSEASMLAKDRRQTLTSAAPAVPAAPGSTSSPAAVRYLTKRPYNLRNTTYKNLLLSNSPLPSPLSAAGPPTYLSSAAAVETPQFSGGGVQAKSDISTTTAASSPVSASSSSTAANEANEPHTYKHETNNETHFDDQVNSSSGPDSFANHSLAYQESEARSRTSAAPQLGERYLELANDEHDKLSTRDVSSAGAWPAGQRPEFRPESVNEIVAHAKKANFPSSPANAEPAAERAGEPRVGVASDIIKNDNDGARSEAAADALEAAIASANRNADEQEVTPHQYQIQVRWNNSTTSEGHKVPPAGEGARQAKRLGEAELELDRMKERVRDRLFEHREEEHWHDKHWLKAAKRRKLVAGKWVVVPVQAAPGTRHFDYGPHAHLRETPIKNQLANEPSEEQSARHFAIPTPNFRQSPKFVDWVLRDVNMDEEPGGPPKRAAKA